MASPIEILRRYQREILEKVVNLDDEIRMGRNRRNMLYIALSVSEDKEVRDKWRRFLEGELKMGEIGYMQAYQTISRTKEEQEGEYLFIMYNIEKEEFVKLLDRDGSNVKSVKNI